MALELKEFRDKIESFWRDMKEDYGILTVLFFLSATSLMLYQHSLGWSWDFNVYSMIGSYIFHGGFYMEWLRPPLASVFMGLLQFIFSRAIAEYVFIDLTSLFFLYSCRRFSESFEISLETFYVFALTPYVILFSTINGTEMLSLGFVLLFLAEFERPRSGLWLGLSFLTRYNFGLIIPLVLIQRDLRKIFKTGVISALTLVPWLLYNFIETGSFLTSFGNFLMLNVFLRYASTPLDPQNFLIMTLPTAAVLLTYFREEIRQKMEIGRDDLLMISFSVLVVLSYLTADYRSLRYLYPLTVPTAFYAARAWKQIDRDRIIILLAGLNIVLAGIAIDKTGMTPSDKYIEASEAAGNCMAESESWVLTNYAGTPTRPLSNDNITFKRLGEGYRSISFKGPEYRNLSAPVIEETERFTVYGYEELCRNPGKADRTYLEGFNERNDLNYTFKGYMYDRFIKNKLEALNQ